MQEYFGENRRVILANYVNRLDRGRINFEDRSKENTYSSKYLRSGKISENSIIFDTMPHGFLFPIKSLHFKVIFNAFRFFKKICVCLYSRSAESILLSRTTTLYIQQINRIF